MLAREPTQTAPALSDPRAMAQCQRLSGENKDGSGGPEDRGAVSNVTTIPIFLRVSAGSQSDLTA